MRKLVTSLTRSFGIVPDRASRYFSISLRTSLDTPLSSTNTQITQACLQKSSMPTFRSFRKMELYSWRCRRQVKLYPTPTSTTYCSPLMN